MKSDKENKEWLDDYTALKQVNSGHPFIVPEGYFDELGKWIKSYVNLNELNANGDGFTLPENYFNELSSNIQSRITIEEYGNAESKEVVLPENYFDELSASIQSRITIEEFANADNEHFTVPDGYFDSLQQQINARIVLEDAMTYPEESFNVPAGYFDKLNRDILNKTVIKDKIKRKGIVRKLFATAAFKYAAAACFALVIGGALLLNQYPNAATTHNNSFLHKQVSTITVSDIQSYLQQDVDAGDTQHAVIDQGAPVNDADLNNALQGHNTDTNQ
jgi:hypothetical protein